MNTTEPTIDNIHKVLFKLRTTHEVEHNDNQWSTEFVYTLEEAEAELDKLISDQVAKARKEERSLALMYLHDTNREQDYLRKLNTLNGVKNK
jgi:hypothetical protein